MESEWWTPGEYPEGFPRASILPDDIDGRKRAREAGGGQEGCVMAGCSHGRVV